MISSILGEETRVESGKNHTASKCQEAGLNLKPICWETVFHGSLKTLTAPLFLISFKGYLKSKAPWKIMSPSESQGRFAHCSA